MPYDGENMNASSDNEENNDEVSPDPPTNDISINANPNDKKNDYEVTPDTPKNGENNETIENNEEKIMKKIMRRKQIMKTWI